MSAATAALGPAARAGLRSGLVFAWRVLLGVVRWTDRHLRYVVAVTALGFGVRLFPGGQPAAIRVLLVAWLAPALVSAVWSHLWPGSYQRVVAGPSARLGWLLWARRRWAFLARECGLSVQRDQRRSMTGRVVDTFTSKPAPALPKVWVHPRLCSTTANGVTLTITVRARTGQTVEDLEKAAPALAAAARARSFRCRALSPSTVEYVLVMADRLTATREAAPPVDITVEAVPVGRRQDGTPWVLPLLGRHTLVVGCSGSGKGSIFWGVCGGLAPAVRAGLVRLWGGRPQTRGRGRHGPAPVHRGRHHPRAGGRDAVPAPGRDRRTRTVDGRPDPPPRTDPV